jgi:HlyD family secretion protein
MTTSVSEDAKDKLQRLLDNAAGTPARSGRRWLAYTAAGAVAVALAAALLTMRGSGPAQKFITDPASTGDLVVTASASGTLVPTKSVDVGSELSGTVAAVLVDENEVVKRGQVLAQIDKSRLADAVIKSQAAVQAAEGQVAQAQATVVEAQSTLARMRQVAELSGGKVPAKAELDTAEAAVQRAIASEATARGQAAQARATLKTDQTNLTKADIRSPVDGVVLTRKVEPGNTVVAAMASPVLFVVANDLTRMQLEVKVDEADVASVRVGQPASFTVSAWPGRSFPAAIRRVGLGATTTDNVVTYKTVLDVDNKDLALRPGMTATASIVTARRTNALLVSNAALRFTPPERQAAGQQGGIMSRLMPRLPAQPKKAGKATSGANGDAQVWILAPQGVAQPVRVKVGVSDGRHTEIVGGELKPGMAVITDYEEPAK